MNKVKITYYGMDGEGKNVTEAKRDAGRKIEQAMAGNYCPTVLSWRGCQVLVWRDTDCWHVSNLPSEQTEFSSRSLSWSSPEADCSDALMAARSLLAQSGWRHEDGFTLPEPLDFRNKDAQRVQSQFRSWVRFQLLMRAAIARGLANHEAHTLACGCLGRPDLVEVYRELVAELPSEMAAAS